MFQPHFVINSTVALSAVMFLITEMYYINTYIDCKAMDLSIFTVPGTNKQTLYFLFFKFIILFFITTFCKLFCLFLNLEIFFGTILAI